MVELTRRAKTQYIATTMLVAVATWLGLLIGASL